MRARPRKVMILLPGVPRRCSSWWRPGRWRTMTAASETETLSRETPALPPTPLEGALTTPLREDGETGGTRWLRLAAQAPPGPCPVPCRRGFPSPLGGWSLPEQPPLSPLRWPKTWLSGPGDPLFRCLVRSLLFPVHDSLGLTVGCESFPSSLDSRWAVDRIAGRSIPSPVTPATSALL